MSKKKESPNRTLFLFRSLQNIYQTKPRVVETVHANSTHASFVLYRKYVRIASVFYEIFHHSYLTCKQIMTI